MTIKTVFLDRDGVINVDKNYLYKIIDFEFIAGIFEACLYFKKLGYEIVIVTNQSGIARGFYSQDEYEELTNWMLLQFRKKDIDILDVFHCPHIQEINCNCRKPKPGMFIKAKNKHKIDMDKSWIIGDKERDISAAHMAGITKSILMNYDNKENSVTKAKFIANSILDTMKIIH